MLYDRLQEYIQDTKGLSLEDKIAKLRRVFYDLKSKNVSRQDISESDFFLILESLIKPDTPDNIKSSVEYYLSLVVGDILNVLDHDNVEAPQKETKAPDELEDWAQMAPEELIDLKPEEMASRENDEEFLNSIGVKDPYE